MSICLSSQPFAHVAEEYVRLLLDYYLRTFTYYLIYDLTGPPVQIRHKQAPILGIELNIKRYSGVSIGAIQPRGILVVAHGPPFSY